QLRRARNQVVWQPARAPDLFPHAPVRRPNVGSRDCRIPRSSTSASPSQLRARVVWSRWSRDKRGAWENENGSGWESNPPNSGVRRFTGFEDRDGHQSRIRSQRKNLLAAISRCAVEDATDKCFIILGHDGPQVNQNAALLHARKHRWVAKPQVLGDLV